MSVYIRHYVAMYVQMLVYIDQQNPQLKFHLVQLILQYTMPNVTVDN